MITLTLNLNPNATYPILAREGLSSPGIVPTLTVGDRYNLSLKFWEGAQGASSVENKQLDGLSFIKFGSKVSKASSTLVIYVDDFTEFGTSGNYSYKSELNLNTVELTAALDGKDSIDLFTDIELTFTNGQRQTLQFKHTVRNQVVDNENPPEAIQEPNDILFSAVFLEWLDLPGNSGKSTSDFINSLKSTVPGPPGYVTGSAGVSDLGGTSRELNSTDNGKILMNSGGACTVTVPAGMPTGFLCEIIQFVGQVTIAAGSGMTVGNSFGFTKTRAPYSAASIRYLMSTIAITAGDMA